MRLCFGHAAPLKESGWKIVAVDSSDAKRRWSRLHERFKSDGIGQLRTSKQSETNLRSRQVGVPKAATMQIDIAQIRMTQIGLVQICISERCPSEFATDELRAAERRID